MHMHGWYDGVMVGTALLASSLYAMFSLAPRSFKRGLTRTAALLLKLAPRMPGLDRLAGRLAAAASVSAKASCGGCDHCGPAPQQSVAQTAADAVGQAAGQAVGQGTSQVVGQTAAVEIGIPVSKIGKRSHKAQKIHI